MNYRFNYGPGAQSFAVLLNVKYKEKISLSNFLACWINVNIGKLCQCINKERIYFSENVITYSRVFYFLGRISVLHYTGTHLSTATTLCSRRLKTFTYNSLYFQTKFLLQLQLVTSGQRLNGVNIVITRNTPWFPGRWNYLLVVFLFICESVFPFLLYSQSSNVLQSYLFMFVCSLT